MSDNEDLLADDLGDHSLADYNLGNDEEDQLLADDYEGGHSHVPPSMASYEEGAVAPPHFPEPEVQYTNQRIQYHLQPDTECVVPNIMVEVPNAPERPSYAPYEPPKKYICEVEQHVPPAMPAVPMEPPQIVPTEMPDAAPRARFAAERPAGAQRTPRHRDIPDSLDAVVVPRGGGGPRARWRPPHYGARHHNPYRRNNMHRGNFNPRASFPPPRNIRPNSPQIPPNIRPNPRQMRPDSPLHIRPDLPPNRPDLPHNRSDLPHNRPDLPHNRPDLPPNRPDLPPNRPDLPPNRPGLPPNMRHDVPPNRPDLPPNMRPEVPPNLRPDVPPNLRPDVPPNLRPDIPANMRPDVPPNRPDLPPNMRSDLPPNMRPDLPPNMRPDLPPNVRPDLPHNRPDLPPNIHPDLPRERLPPNPELDRPEFPEMRPDLPLPPGQDLPPEGLVMDQFRPMEVRPFRYPYRQNEPRQFNPNMRPNFEPFGYQRPFRPFPPMREVVPNMNHLPQVTIRHGGPVPLGGPLLGKQEVRMLPVLPPVPGGLQGKKVLINPHFKGNFQPPVEVLASAPTYIPTRIQKTPPLSPTLEDKFGPVKDIDDAAERFIAEQRNALARAATRKFPPRRSPQRYVENTTIEIENELARPPRRRSEDDDLLRRQEEFINANRAGLRRRMRSPTPPRRSVSPRRSPERLRPRIDARPEEEEDSEYRRRMREQEALRDRVMRAKEVRRRKRAVAATNATPATSTTTTTPATRVDNARVDNARVERTDDYNRERERFDKPEPKPVPRPVKPAEVKEPDAEPDKPDTTRTSPDKGHEKKETEKEKERDRSPVRKEEEAEVNSTCEALTPPLKPAADSDDDLDLILGDIDGILSDDDDSGRFKHASAKPEPPKPQTDLRAKLPPKPTKTVDKKPKQRIVFGEEKQEKEKQEREKQERRRKEKTPPRRAAAVSSTKAEEEKKATKVKERTPPLKESKLSMRQRITFNQREAQKQKDAKEKEKDEPKSQFSNRRVILQRKVSQTDKSVFTRIEVTDPTKPNPGIFSRAVRTLGTEKSRIVINKKQDEKEPQIEYESDSDLDEDKLLEEEIGNLAVVTNLPHGMTDTRLKTLAGSDVQSLTLDKEDRSAKITFKTTSGAENFKKKFNNKMVAASRLAVTLR